MTSLAWLLGAALLLLVGDQLMHWCYARRRRRAQQLRERCCELCDQPVAGVRVSIRRGVVHSIRLCRDHLHDEIQRDPSPSGDA